MTEQEDPPAGVPIAVAAVDDHPLVLRGLQSYLAEQVPDIRLDTVVATVDELLTGPHDGVTVVLLDLHLGDGTVPEENVRRIGAAGPRVVLFTSEHRPAVVRRSLDAGAVGLVLKEDPEASLVEAVRAAHAGRFYASSRLAHQVVTDPAGLVRLSEREGEVLALVARGLPWAAIGRHLGMSVETARTYSYRALEKYARSGSEPISGLRDLAFRAVVDGQVHTDEPPSAGR